MLAQHRRQPVGLVALGVVLRADPEEADVEQAHGARQHQLAREARAASWPGVAPAARSSRATRRRSSGSASPNADHRIELQAVPVRPPALVVEVLLAAGSVDAGGLKVSQRIHADPHLPPRRRHRERGDAREHLRVVDPLPVRVQVFGRAPPPAAPDARGRARRPAKPGRHQVSPSTPGRSASEGPAPNAGAYRSGSAGGAGGAGADGVFPGAGAGGAGGGGADSVLAGPSCVSRSCSPAVMCATAWPS